jgi:hypothetical protein
MAACFGTLSVHLQAGTGTGRHCGNDYQDTFKDVESNRPQTRVVQQRVASAHTAVPDLAPVDENNALVRRLMAIGKRVTGDGR